MKKHVKLDENYFLVSQEVNPNATVEVVKSINHLIIVDVSGSMSYDLPEIRKNLKNKISSLVKENDTVSIIWFSGRNDAGILKEEVHVNSLKQLNDLSEKFLENQRKIENEIKARSQDVLRLELINEKKDTLRKFSDDIKVAEHELEEMTKKKGSLESEISSNKTIL